jgi:predicted PurR-regulated permease PerM
MPNENRPQLSSSGFAKRVAIAAAIALLAAALATFLWTVSQAVLVIFAAILFAVMLNGLTRPLSRWTRLPHGAALAVVIIGISVGLAGIFALGGFRVSSQASELRHDMQQSIGHIQDKLRGMGIPSGSQNLQSLSKTAIPHISKFFGHMNGYLSASFDMIADLFVIVVAGIYFAANPAFYTGTFVKLLPERRRRRMDEVTGHIGHALRRWLIGRFVSMVSVGVLTGVGLTLLHVKLALLLAIIGMLFTFVPYIGTLISLIPAVLIAVLTSPMTAVYVVILYLVAHTLEGYVISPLIQARTVHLAPGWLILSQLLGGLAAGLFGVLIAAPMMVTLTVIVQILYVEDVLGDTPRILGE